jgi:hypothetical protein
MENPELLHFLNNIMVQFSHGTAFIKPLLQYQAITLSCVDVCVLIGSFDAFHVKTYGFISVGGSYKGMLLSQYTTVFIHRPLKL